MNILDKTDKGMKEVFSKEVTIPKNEAYSWSEPCVPGQFKLINKVDLNIDGSYQRERASNKKVMDIARSWDWKLFGTISVVRRKDGTFWVYDGGHRTRASFHRSDIKVLPCMVFNHDGNTLIEAKAFYGKQKMRTNVSAFDGFRAATVAMEPLALKTQDLLNEYGYTASNSTGKLNNICCISALQSVIKLDDILARKVFELCVEMDHDQKSIQGNTLSGLHTLALHFKDQGDILNGKYRNKIVKAGIAGISRAIKDEQYESGRSGNVVFAKGILKVINARARHRLAW